MDNKQNVEIVLFDRRYKSKFKELNVEWITRYFDLEAEDNELLNNPEKTIIQNGDFILMALLDLEPVGTCAMVYLKNGTFELCNMCVSPNVKSTIRSTQYPSLKK